MLIELITRAMSKRATNQRANRNLPVCFIIAWLALAATTYAEEPIGSAARTDSVSELVPQNLLRLVHAPEVQRELGFSPEQINGLEEFFEQVDGTWFRSRVLPADKQMPIMAELETKLHGWLSKHTSTEQRERLQQLEYRSLGIRMLLRNDAAKQIGLDATQRAEFTKLARATQDALAAAQAASQRGEIPDKLQTAAVEAAQAEHAALKTQLRPEQLQKITKLLGAAFDTSTLERIYPMAPELIPVEHWLNSPPLRLKELRGKVVLVHFYAFQCHNCHANFKHYNQWHEEFGGDEVVVIGIQTPETSTERDPQAVAAAAKERGFRFPVVIDLESANWKAWSNTMWPTIYVIDKQGYIRYVWQGELNWEGATHDKTVHDLLVKLVHEDAEPASRAEKTAEKQTGKL